MDILHLVDRLEELFNESRSIPFTHSVIIDEDRMLDIIDQMRVSIPEEIKKAQQIMAQRERFIAQAQEEAGRITALAREKSDQMVQNDNIMQAAKTRAEQIVAQSRTESEATKREADQYAWETLNSLEIELDRSLNQVRNGIRTLRSESQMPGTPTE